MALMRGVGRRVEDADPIVALGIVMALRLAFSFLPR
jgi:hypothetical protein